MSVLARAAWSLLVAHFLASHDIVYGVVINSAVPSAGGEAVTSPTQVAGPTNAVIPSRTRLDFDTMDVSTLLARLHQQSVEEHAHAHLGLTEIASLSTACKAACQFTTILVVYQTRTMNGNANEEEHFDLQNHHIFTRDRRLVSEPINLEGQEGFTPHALVISCHPFEQSNKDFLGIHVLFDSRLITKLTAETVLNGFSTLLHNILACSPETPLRSLSALSGAPNYGPSSLPGGIGEAPEPVSAFAHELISSSAMLRPQDEAIHSWDGSMTYYELECSSSAMATKLAAAQQTSADEWGVAFMLDRSKHALITILAILKAGCFFVPLDPQHPIIRLQNILRTVNVSMIVSQEKYQSILQELPCNHLLVEDVDFRRPAHENNTFASQTEEMQRIQDCVRVRRKDCDPAFCTSYVIFTSGSTGQPKGVVIKHEALSTALVALGRSPPLPERSRFLHIGNYVFDVAIYEILVTLLYGGTVCIPSEHERHFDLEGFIGSARVTDAATTPSVSRALDCEKICKSTGLQRLRLGGKAVGLQGRIRWNRPESDLPLHCIYGITEAAIANFHHPVRGNDVIYPRLIGKPINCKAWVRSVHNPSELALPEAVGELCLEGPVLAAGYLCDPVRTAEVFVTEPVWLPKDRAHELNKYSASKRRIYCTRDLVYADHQRQTVSFVRRKDDSRQFKLRGLRIDLQEIENAIENVSAAGVAVELLTPPGEQPFLCACVHCTELGNSKTPRTPFNLRDMRDALAQTLPSFMMPSYFVSLSSIPLSAVGKRDHTALRAMMESAIVSERASSRSLDTVLLTE
ncbi:HC-toxin synthetase [Fulvia fulva]|uniref:HC-toxin synthetase n=1 Tax=Passalora fulva TaxID=5499 RepID=A0A9Q8P5Z6_PASFU|nr:HC-toxin synthetase [Fulvia fulva]KAK4632050.1 HC-toxin synthetase [Fulvia fulva]KAK4632556.1 HC-toxin synthetase [Fulvia fulva]UJO14431.1 HC-toxin synthetase [Fulvia fulva]WPV10782.1 HC-toxin synthetase [Fulvia fulva]WPV25556.1 HC-toxin synthetase [Fulvia fulva]